MKMELKAQYDMDDLLDLVEQDLEAKGFRLVGGINPTIKTGEDFLLTLAIEQFQPLAPIRPALPTPALPSPIDKAKPQAQPKTKVKTPEQKEKDRAYKREWQEKKRKLQKAGEEALKLSQSIPEVVAPATVPFHYQQPEPALNGNYSNGHSTNHLNQNS